STTARRSPSELLRFEDGLIARSALVFILFHSPVQPGLFWIHRQRPIDFHALTRLQYVLAGIFDRLAEDPHLVLLGIDLRKEINDSRPPHGFIHGGPRLYVQRNQALLLGQGVNDFNPDLVTHPLTSNRLKVSLVSVLLAKSLLAKRLLAGNALAQVDR